MKVIVLGAGVIGVTTAYFLARQGAEVTVIDRQREAGLETSFANAGELSYGMTSPWAAPGVPKKALKWLFMKYRPLMIWPLISPSMWSWALKMYSNCNEAAYRVNKSRMVRVSNYSRDVLKELTEDLPLDFDLRQQGTLQLFRSEKQLEASKLDQMVLEEFESPFEVLDREGCIRAEPGLSKVAHKFVGGLRLTSDRTGDCRKFTAQLSKEAEKLGVKFRFNENLKGFTLDGDRVTAAVTDIGEFTADRFVCCLGSYSARLMQPLGIRLPIYPVKGYSITLPVTDPDAAPQSTLMDETYKVAITRLGDRIRVAGQAELIGYNMRLGKHATDAVRHVVQDLFPEGGDVSQAENWTGLRPMTPDGTPILGRTKLKNLFLNTGHGTLGWTMACGSGKAVADLVTGKQPEISFEGLEASRY
ncbi:D-amino acid dehydrogenase [Leisingera sp. ANG-DT]|uniref:D-amino acid dehydrogenase n=1 Tax=Leisingera sp. ANG-DT TaxID=1577897 RepID=UPI00057D77EE|nr:D-amino acid dehydrogenase [Leisingera sp. ANG-DT]KIC15824.1 amino acid dehydrogenase [Leisingera sp. ANG-DT]